jgi:hypothetical protein
MTTKDQGKRRKLSPSQFACKMKNVPNAYLKIYNWEWSHQSRSLMVLLRVKASTSGSPKATKAKKIEQTRVNKPA